MIDWGNIRRVLVVRLRSIGDTVLSTPSLIALRKALPNARIDVLLEDWVAPVLDGFEEIDSVIKLNRSGLSSKVDIALTIRRASYDVAFNLHGGTTATFLVWASGAKYRIAFREVRYNFLYTHLLSSAADFWGKPVNHSAEQQLALLGFVGIDVIDRPKTRLVVTEQAKKSLLSRLSHINGFKLANKIALIHPGASLETKRWGTEKFAYISDFLYHKGFQVIAVASKSESNILMHLRNLVKKPIYTLDDLSLPEITALAEMSSIFVGNDSGIAHIAAAVKTPSIVIFGSSNVKHWHPWTDAPNRVVKIDLPCQPCHGYFCAAFDKPKCIMDLPVHAVVDSIESLLESRIGERVVTNSYAN